MHTLSTGTQSGIRRSPLECQFVSAYSIDYRSALSAHRAHRLLSDSSNKSLGTVNESHQCNKQLNVPTEDNTIPLAIDCL
jgi:hypothetical protein